MSNKQEKSVRSKSKGRVSKIIKGVFVALVGVGLLIFFGVPLYLSSAGGTRFLVDKINTSVDGQIQMDDFSIGWFKGVNLRNLSYADSAGNTSVNVRRIETQPKYMALLGGKVKLGKTVVEGPQIYLKVVPEEEQKPVSSGPAASVEKPSESSPMFPVNQINLQLIDGSATIELVGNGSQKVHFTNIASNVQIADVGKPSSLDLTMDIDEMSKITAKGTATPSEKDWTLMGGDFDVQISKLQLASLKPIFALTGQEMDMTGELNVDMAVAIGDNKIQRIKGNATVSNFVQGGIVFSEPLTIDADVSGIEKDLQIKTLKVQSQFCHLDCSGTQKALEFSLDADLKQTQQFIGQFTDMSALSMAGALSARGRASMADEGITVSGAGGLKQFRLQKETATTAVTDAQLEFDFSVDNATQQLRVSRANLISTPGTVTLSDVVIPMSEQGDPGLTMNVRAALELEKAWPFTQILLDDFYDTKVFGQMDADCSINSKGSQIHLLTEGSRIQNLKIELPDQPIVQDEVVLNADVLLDTEDKTIDIRTLDMEGAQGESLIKVTKGAVKKKISNSQTRINGDFEVEYDWQTISVFARPFLPDGLQVRGHRKDAFSFESLYPTENPEQMTANLNGSGSLGFATADYFGMHFGSTELKVDIRKGVASFQIPTTTVNEGKLQLAGNIDLNEEPRFLRLSQPMLILDKIHINDTMTRLLLLYTNPMFVDASQASGIASFDCRQMAIPLSGEHKNMTVIEGTFWIDQLRMRAGSFMKQILALFKASDTVMMRVHPTFFTLRNGSLSYPDMQVDVEDNPLNFKGEIGLDKSLAMNVKLPWTHDFHSVKTDRPAQNRITLPVEGTLDSPRINTAALIEQQGRQLIEQELKKQLERLLK